jgi:hypothetical protein
MVVSDGSTGLPAAIALSFPVLTFSEEMFAVKTTTDELTTCPAHTLRGAEFRDMLIVDSNGMAFNVERAQKVRNAGLTWVGLFPIRLIQVDLLYRDDALHLSVDEIRQHIYNATFSWHELEAGGADAEVREQLERAQSVTELIQLIARSQ